MVWSLRTITWKGVVCKDTELDVEAYPEGDMRVRPPHRLCNPSSMILVKYVHGPKEFHCE